MCDGLSDYDVLSVLGTGSFGPCYKVFHKKTNKYYVLKAVDYSALLPEQKQITLTEINYLSDMLHPNIVTYHKYLTHKPSQTLYIVMNFCDGQDLSQLIKKCQQTHTFLDESFIWKVLYQLSRALQWCHVKIHILHRNIRPANVFIDDFGNAKLGDFAVVRNTDRRKDLDSCFYMSPELLRTGKYSRKSDIWALGCLIYELCSLTPPFIGSNWEMLNVNIRQCNLTRIPTHYSEEMQRILNLMLTMKPELRSNIETILYHPAIVTRMTTTSLEQLSMEETRPRSSNSSVPESSGSSRVQCTKCTSLDNKHQVLKQKEKILKAKETSLMGKELILNKREKQVALMEKLVKDKLSKADQYLKQSKNGQKNIESDSSCCGDLDDSVSQPQAQKLSPSKIIKPSFVRNNQNRRTVHFENARNLQTIHEYSVDEQRNEKVWLDNKRLNYRSANMKEENKENVCTRLQRSNSQSSVQSLKAQTVESKEGIIETYFL